MKVLLVCPQSNFPHVGSRWLRIPQLVLPVLAALTPPKHEVRTVEEAYERVPLDEDWDVVGISAMTAVAPRAYELAAQFRQRGAKVVLGGIHPTVLPREAARHADAVVVGEAEGVWPQVLHDAERNQLKPFYRNLQPDLARSPLPRRDRRHSAFSLVPYLMPVMASRGCPYDCEFCCVHRVYGRKQRHVPVEQIVRDIRRTRANRLMFLDDNIGAVRPYAMKLFAALRPLRRGWCAQASTRFVLDRELFDAAVRCGLEGLFVGIESIQPEARKRMRKSPQHVSMDEDAIRRCRDAGVIFHASLIFGLDEQTPRAFDHAFEFLTRNRVPTITANILTPYPGTRLFDRLRREGRILHTNWSYYDHHSVCFQPKDMDPEELAARYLDFGSRFFSYASILRRASAQMRVSPLVYLCMNRILRKSVKLERNYVRDYFRWLRREKDLSSEDRGARFRLPLPVPVAVGR
jgi:radical SAM superfamily enzyme YgiQ (UPF0313 family)